MYTHGLLASAGTDVLAPSTLSRRALYAANEAAEESQAMCGQLCAVEETESFLDDALCDLEDTQRYLGGFQDALESIKEGNPQYNTASLEASIKEMAQRLKHAILEWIRKAKEYAVKLWRAYTDRAQIIHRKANGLKSKLDGKAFTPEESEEIAQALVEHHPQHVRAFSVDKGNDLVIHPNQVALFKKFIDRTVDAQEADKKIARGILQRVKNQVKHANQDQDVDGELDANAYAAIILKHLGKGPVAPGGMGFSKEGVIESYVQELDKFKNVKTQSLQSGLAKFGARDANFPSLMEFVLAVTKEGSTFSTDVETIRREYFDQLQSTTESAVEAVMKTKGYDDSESEAAVRSVQAVVKNALELGYRATTVLYRAWLQALASMLVIASAYASKRV